MALTFNFERVKSSIFGEIFRPVAQALFYSEIKKRWYEVWMVVDTGADYTILPRYFAERLGIDLVRDCRLFKTAGIGGSEKVYLLNRIKTRLGDWERVIPVGFLDRDEVPPLLGRRLFLETFETRFSTNHRVTFSQKVGRVEAKRL